MKNQQIRQENLGNNLMTEIPPPPLASFAAWLEGLKAAPTKAAPTLGWLKEKNDCRAILCEGVRRSFFVTQ